MKSILNMEQGLSVVVIQGPQAQEISAIEALQSAHHVVTVMGYDDAVLSQVLRQRPDVIVLAAEKDQHKAPALVQKLRHQADLDFVPILLLVPQGCAAEARVAMYEGGDDYLIAPWQAADVLWAVQGLKNSARRYQHHVRRQVDRSRGAMLAMLPHQLRTPLTSIVGITDLLIHRYARYPDTQKIELLREVYKASVAMGRDISRVMRWVELDAQTGADAVVSSTDTGGACEAFEVLAWLKDLLQDQEFVEEIAVSLPVPTVEAQTDGVILGGHTVRMDVAPGDIGCRKTDFRSMVQELLSNACTFSAAGAEVTITGHCTDSVYVLDVANVGDPLPKDFLDQMGAFVQIDREAHEQQGLGLGLALTRMLAQKNGVNLSVPRVDGNPNIARLLFQRKARIHP